MPLVPFEAGSGCVKASEVAPLKQWLERLLAVEIEPKWYAWPSPGATGVVWFVASEQHLTDLLNFEGPDAERKLATAMPAWWSPEQRFAWRWINYVQRFKTRKEAEAFETEAPLHGGRVERITADLETGAEIPA